MLLPIKSTALRRADAGRLRLSIGSSHGSLGGHPNSKTGAMGMSGSLWIWSNTGLGLSYHCVEHALMGTARRSAFLSRLIYSCGRLPSALTTRVPQPRSYSTPVHAYRKGTTMAHPARRGYGTCYLITRRWRPPNSSDATGALPGPDRSWPRPRGGDQPAHMAGIAARSLNRLGLPDLTPEIDFLLTECLPRLHRSRLRWFGWMISI